MNLNKPHCLTLFYVISIKHDLGPFHLHSFQLYPNKLSVLLLCREKLYITEYKQQAYMLANTLVVH